MEQVVERGTAQRRADSRLHHRRQDRHRGQAGERPLLEVGLQRVVRRVRPVAQSGADDPRRHRLAARQRLLRRRRLGADLQADRRSRAAPTWASARTSTRRRRCWWRGTIRRTTPTPRPRRSRRARPACCRPTVEPARNGLMPDLRGLSAREALQALSRIGMTAQMSGDGFVVEQSPEAGSALERGNACALTLGRRAPVAPTGGCRNDAARAPGAARSLGGTRDPGW